MGRLIPAGSGVSDYASRKVKVDADEVPEPKAENFKIGPVSLESLAGLL